MATSQKEKAILYFTDVLKMEGVAKMLQILDDEECLASARNRVGGFLGDKKLQEFEDYLSNGH